jgi:queuine tRNA-ribosyltransferase
MPVATLAVLRSQDTSAVHDLGFPVLLANTYHLLLRPGTEVFRRFGGIHSFMNWNRSVLTDSGGYQIFSLSKKVKISEAGAIFRSYHDGKKILLSPETSIETQRIISSDIMMAMDWCVPSDSEKSLCMNAADITARWAERSLAARGDSLQSMFGIVQGACFPDLRKTSAGQITSLPFDGFAIGGLAVGEAEDDRKDITELTASLLPRNYPRYLMGVGTPIDLLEAVHRGIDMFDCILPTAMGQQGVVWTSSGRMELRRGVYRLQDRPLDETCNCPACSRYSRAYIHHLIKSGEYYGSNLAGIHNLSFYRNIMNSMREHIIAGTFPSYYKEQKEKFVLDDNEYPVTPPKRKKKRILPAAGDYEIVRHVDGFHSIRHMKSGLLMHGAEPLAEAKFLFIENAGFMDMLSDDSEDELVILDITLGSGAIAMTAIMDYEKIYARNPRIRPMRIISYGRNTDALKLAVRHQELFYHTRHSAPGVLLRNGMWKSQNLPLHWNYVEYGTRLNYSETLKPHCVFYNPFPPEEDYPGSYNTFSEIFSLNPDTGIKLFTGNNSFPVRGALLAAGFYTGIIRIHGIGTEITAAYTLPGKTIPGIKLLGHNWLTDYRKNFSQAPECPDCMHCETIDKSVASHPQFNLK